MSLPGVSSQIKDGGLGILPPNANIVGVVGTAGAAEKEQLLIISNPLDAEEKLVSGSALEHVRDIFAVVNAPSKVYVVLADPTGGTAADPGTVVHTGTGNADTETGGTPASDRYYQIKVTQGANLDVDDGKYILSSDAGVTWGPEKTFPSSGAAIELDNGASITFTNSTTSPELVEGDVYRWKAVEAKPTTAKLLDAFKILDNEREIGRILVALDVDSTFAASVSTVLTGHNNDNRYLSVYLQAEKRDVFAAETIDEWITRLNTDWDDFFDERILVCPAYGTIQDVKGQSLIRNKCGLAIGLRSGAKICDSIGHVRRFPLPMVTSIVPTGITEAQIETLHDHRFTVARYWDGYGYRFARALGMATETSDFQRIEDTETLYKAVRAVIAAGVPWVESTADPASNPAFQADLERPLVNMRDIDKEISDFSLTLLETDILSTGEIKAQVAIVPFGKRKQISLTFGFTRSVA